VNWPSGSSASSPAEQADRGSVRRCPPRQPSGSPPHPRLSGQHCGQASGSMNAACVGSNGESIDAIPAATSASLLAKSGGASGRPGVGDVQEPGSGCGGVPVNEGPLLVADDRVPWGQVVVGDDLFAVGRDERLPAGVGRRVEGDGRVVEVAGEAGGALRRSRPRAGGRAARGRPASTGRPGAGQCRPPGRLRCSCCHRSTASRGLSSGRLLL
jgi:hypothetical protein